MRVTLCTIDQKVIDENSPKMNVALFVSLLCVEAALLVQGVTSSTTANASRPIFSTDLDPIYAPCRYVRSLPIRCTIGFNIYGSILTLPDLSYVHT